MAQRHALEEENEKGGKWLPYIPYKEGQWQQVSMGTKQEPHPHWSGRKKQLMPHIRGERTAQNQKCQPGLLLIPGFPTGLSKLGHTTVYKQSLCPLTRIQHLPSPPHAIQGLQGPAWPVDLTHSVGPGRDVPPFLPRPASQPLHRPHRGTGPASTHHSL